ncbi:MAG: UDP-N-acetylglucosamine 2-epimerase (non-hydrolyzing) [Myxococcota bacterium]
MTVIGARPQFIKAVSVSRALAGSGAEELLVHTGQHYDEKMSAIFFDELGIPKPRYNLGIHGGSHGQMTGKMVAAIEQVLLDEEPKAVLVFGDTNSTLAAGLAAVKLHIPVIHVEAGLRSFDRGMPEEINRVVVDQISSLLFCPTKPAITNLRSEGIYGDNRLGQRVVKNGDVMLDTFEAMRPWFNHTIVGALGVEPQKYALATVHRADNTDSVNALRDVFGMLDRAADRVGTVVFPMHPRTRARLGQLGVEPPARVKMVEPLGYLDMMGALHSAALLLTDSGGMQKEALWARVPCITLRPHTEWIETVEAGFNQIVGRDRDRLERAISQLDGCDFEGTAYRDLMTGYGSGRAASIVAEETMSLLER